MPKYHSKPEEKSEVKIIIFEPMFRNLGKMLDEMVNWIINTFKELPEQQRKKLLEELSKK